MHKLHPFRGQHLRFAIASLAALLLTLLVLASARPASCDAIHNAARDGDVAKVQALLKSDPGMVSWKDGNGATPLHWAAAAGRKEVVELLLANKAEVDARDKLGVTPLCYAAGNGQKEVAALLLANKADVNANSSQSATTAPPTDPLLRLLTTDSSASNPKTAEGARPLNWAVAGDRRDVAELLLSSGADVTVKGKNGQTPLHQAVGLGFKDMTELLLANKADVAAKDHVGQTPLHVVVAAGHKDVADLLLANKADINAKDNMGQTPLHVAAVLGQKDMAEWLLASGAGVDAKRNDGRTPLHLAVASGHHDLAELLLANHADVNAKDNDAESPLSSAVAAGHNDMAEFLRQHGAISKPNDAALLALSKFLQKAYFIPRDASEASRFNPDTAPTYRKDKATYYKGFALIDDGGYTFELNRAFGAAIVGVPVGQGGSGLAQLPNFIPFGGTVRVKFADVTRIKAERGGFELHLQSGGKDLDSFGVPNEWQHDVHEALRVLCPTAEWK